MKKEAVRIEDMVKIMKLCRSLKQKIKGLKYKAKELRKFQCKHLCFFCKYKKICKEDAE